MTFILSFAVCLSLLATSCLAQFGPWIDVPTDITAGTPATATILPLNLYNYDPEFVSSYTVYLTAAVGANRLDLGFAFLQGQCYLTKDVSVCDPTITIASDHVSFLNTTFAFTIPPSVGPDGANYGISFQLFQTDGSKYSVSSGSNIFNLTSATGNWSRSQLGDYVLSSPDTIPCRSFACVKDCADLFFDVKFLNATNETSYRDCAEKCPNVTIPLAQGESASTTTSADTSLITYTHGQGMSTNMASRSTPLCTVSTSSSSQTEVGVSKTGGGSLATSTGSAASATKSSAASHLLESKTRGWSWGIVGLGALLLCAV